MYALVLTSYPKAFRNEFGAEMKLTFQDLAQEPEIGSFDLACRTFQDLCGGVAMLRDRRPNMTVVRWSAVFGSVVLALWIAGRTLHPGLYLGVPLVATPFVLFVVVGYVGGHITKSFAGGLGAAFLTGLISAISVPGDYLLFGSFPFYDVSSFVLAIAMTAAFCLVPAAIGSFAANLTDLVTRARRGFGAFGSAWRQEPI
jgi:hypothetical protein